VAKGWGMFRIHEPLQIGYLNFRNAKIKRVIHVYQTDE
jgi:hypothetical protein